MHECKWMLEQEWREWCEVQNANAYLSSKVIQEQTAHDILTAAYAERMRLFIEREMIRRRMKGGIGRQDG